MDSSLNNEAQLQKKIIEVMKSEVKDSDVKSMPCCMNIARKVATNMGNVTTRQVKKEIRKMINDGRLLSAHCGTPHIILKEHYDELMLKEHHEELKRKNQKLAVLLKQWFGKIFSIR
jgi:site-specific recombinase